MWRALGADDIRIVHDWLARFAVISSPRRRHMNARPGVSEHPIREAERHLFAAERGAVE